MGSSQLSNSSREPGSPPQPKEAGKLPEKTLGKARGKPYGEVEKTTETKMLEADSTTCNNLAMCYELMAEEYCKKTLSKAGGKPYVMPCPTMLYHALPCLPCNPYYVVFPD